VAVLDKAKNSSAAFNSRSSLLDGSIMIAPPSIEHPARYQKKWLAHQWPQNPVSKRFILRRVHRRPRHWRRPALREAIPSKAPACHLSEPGVAYRDGPDRVQQINDDKIERMIRRTALEYDPPRRPSAPASWLPTYLPSRRASCGALPAAT
jgi:hypothetical protein